MELSQQIIFAFLLTFLAGLSTGIGSLIAYFIKKPKTIYLSFSLGFPLVWSPLLNFYQSRS